MLVWFDRLTTSAISLLSSFLNLDKEKQKSIYTDASPTLSTKNCARPELVEGNEHIFNKVSHKNFNLKMIKEHTSE
ncbi:MAG: hypothetical protein US13_C0008G0005 [candidate division TM6 bacterium GW2011_GWE2_36_25]|nr:MAG: hypothetical protein US03_C0008G0033 [candidate division TM6 bacterium GW2011_GWF2_36_131]KKQ02932.1 MAG: hypothetical protein US13_C0008G0005 [candidate division TM6 bacterium GW2011_GWE2_36_25]KKQ19699.1 MAG: hypothetical protein US32_C0006G0033 [candidate division TM6 bacterium GW2011_GWA2_36_9]